MNREAWEMEEVAARLRAALPAPPPGLRARVLGRVREAPAAKTQQRRVRLRCSVALVACLAAQWLATAALNGQRAAFFTGGGTGAPALTRHRPVVASQGWSRRDAAGAWAFSIGNLPPRTLAE